MVDGSNKDGALTFILKLFRDILIPHIHKQNNTFKFWGKSYCIFYCNENQYLDDFGKYKLP